MGLECEVDHDGDDIDVLNQRSGFTPSPKNRGRSPLLFSITPGTVIGSTSMKGRERLKGCECFLNNSRSPVNMFIHTVIHEQRGRLNT